MVNFMQKASEWVSQQMEAHTSVLVAYKPIVGDDLADISATPAENRFETDEADNWFSELEVRDFIIRISLLSGFPEEGDLIEMTVNGTVQIYEVLPVPGGKCFDFDSVYQNSYRIFTKRVGSQ